MNREEIENYINVIIPNIESELLSDKVSDVDKIELYNI
jgi:hypothetical protein